MAMLPGPPQNNDTSTCCWSGIALTLMVTLMLSNVYSKATRMTNSITETTLFVLRLSRHNRFMLGKAVLGAKCCRVPVPVCCDLGHACITVPRGHKTHLQGITSHHFSVTPIEETQIRLPFCKTPGPRSWHTVQGHASWAPGVIARAVQLSTWVETLDRG